MLQKNKCPLVSIIITTHDRKELLKKAIVSATKQTYENIECIIVDDASTDGTKEMLDSMSKEYTIRYIRISNEESRGGNYARNKGIIAAKGTLIAFLDDDDEWLETKIEKQVDVLNRDIEMGVVSCGIIREYNFSKRVFSDVNTIPEGDLSSRIWEKIPFTTSTILVKKDLLIEVGMFDEKLKYWQEYELLIRLCQVAKVGVVREHLVLYRIIDKDKKRLTNNIDGWMDAVEYIDKKHTFLILDLSEEIKRKHEIQIAWDGLRRSIAVGDKKLQREFLGKIYCLEPTIKNRVKYCLNIPKLKFWS